ncbi:helix-turn-helix domain-containing protein [Caloramator proteoclasticus]|uniref:Helix-turn-helix domain-containing protein n=1 Tax=Caloramator proteoclasticus DSM 10124 TaxID=1121262 RepID=A0A1M4VAF5_9CLOT|nr:helix-turn-helix transcriptional regulator [Caloramator proteoclasticus]SHE65929.1 Helix-turn-helix domain-containing protein [Caloramator proteoclasticus DSM 10124]
METLQIEFGKMVRKYRKDKGYSTQKLAELLGVSVGLVNNIENGKSDVFKLTLFINLISTLNIPQKNIIKFLYSSNHINFNNLLSESDFEFTMDNITLGEKEYFVSKIKNIVNSLIKILNKINYDYDLSKNLFKNLDVELDCFYYIIKNSNKLQK